MTRAQQNYIFFIILFMIPLSGIGVDIYMPSLPAIHHYFAAPASLVKLTLAIYTACYGIGQLFTGTLSDTFGRKKVLLTSLIIYLIITFCITRAGSIGWLLGLRALQGLAISSAGTITRALITDSFEGLARKKVANWMTICWALGPIVAPFIGGYLQVSFGWQASFYFLMGYGFLLFLFVCFAKETNPYRHPLEIRHIANNYRKVLSHGLFWAAVLVLTLYCAAIYIFNVLGPFIIQVELHHSPVFYGHMALLLGICWFAGNVLNRIVISHNKVNLAVAIASSIAAFASIAIIIFGVSHWLSVPTAIIPVGIILLFAGMVFPNAMGLCLSLFPEMAGSASAIAGTLFIALASIVSAIASFLKSESLLPMGILYTVITVVAALIYWCILRRYWQKA